MDTRELNFLTYLIRALIASPSPQTFDQILGKLPSLLPERSNTLDDALETLSSLVRNLSSSQAPDDRLNQIYEKAIKLSKEHNQIAKSVGEALRWAIDSKKEQQQAKFS